MIEYLYENEKLAKPFVPDHMVKSFDKKTWSKISLHCPFKEWARKNFNISKIRDFPGAVFCHLQFLRPSFENLVLKIQMQYVYISSSVSVKR